MEAEQLWKELHHLFDTDEGGLPEIRIVNLSQEGVVAIFSSLQQNCRPFANSQVYWSDEDQQDKPINSVPNAAALVVQGRAAPFHCLCRGLTCEGEMLPDIGVFVFQEEIALDYRAGQEWNARKLKALFGLLKELASIDTGSKVSLDPTMLPPVRTHFEKTWEGFLQATDDV
jgi:hypothetical protein